MGLGIKPSKTRQKKGCQASDPRDHAEANPWGWELSCDLA